MPCLCIDPSYFSGTEGRSLVFRLDHQKQLYLGLKSTKPGFRKSCHLGYCHVKIRHSRSGPGICSEWQVTQNTSPITTDEVSVNVPTRHDHSTHQCHMGLDYCFNFCWPGGEPYIGILTGSVNDSAAWSRSTSCQVSDENGGSYGSQWLLQKEVTSSRKGSKKCARFNP